MDAFFAAVEERDNPQFAKLPIVVGAEPMGGKGRGVVSTANYAARTYGIQSAMPISTAWRLAQQAKSRGNPEAVFLPVDMEKYIRVSQQIMQILAQFSAPVEQVSVDEAYLDISSKDAIGDRYPAPEQVRCGSRPPTWPSSRGTRLKGQSSKSWERAEELTKKIKRAIWEKEQLTCSIGIGPNKLIAKIASDARKPDGLTIVKPEEVEIFLAPLPIRKIPGIGPKTEAKLNAEGIKTIADLRQIPKEEMQNNFGKWGLGMWEAAWGIDVSPVATEPEPAKSIGEQETFQEDTFDPQMIFERLSVLCQRVIERFKASEFKEFKTVTITVRFADFETLTRSKTLEDPAGSLKILNGEAMKLLLPFLDKRENPKGKLIRLLGVRTSRFAPAFAKASAGRREPCAVLAMLSCNSLIANTREA
ncbi:MAG: DNA polymerase IV [candidate division WWE3 bacterium]|nr:DNA polymerase IV [candidate division WWE3 bacterium]